MYHLTAMQAQEHAYARWSVAQRSWPAPARAAQVDTAFDDGRFLRTHVLRPTWHYVVPEDLRWLTRLSAPRLTVALGRLFRDLGLDSQVVVRSTDVIAKTLADGPRTRHELAEAIAGAKIAIDGQRLGNILIHAEINAVVTSGPMRGKQHTYVAFDARVPAGRGPDGDDALSLLAWRYFSTRGPATLKDFAWWSGLRIGDARRALDTVRERLDSRERDGRTYWFVDEGEVPEDFAQTADLVQCYDELIISYGESRDMLHTESDAFRVPLAIDGYRHVVLLGGRLFGHWRVVGSGGRAQLETRVGRELRADESRAVEEAIDSYRRFAALAG